LQPTRTRTQQPSTLNPAPNRGRTGHATWCTLVSFRQHGKHSQPAQRHHAHSILDELRDPSRRPAAPYEPPDDQITTFQPEQPAELPMATIIQNLRCSRKRAAPGPSGLTADTLRLLLDDAPATHQVATVAQHVARAQVPATIASALGLGRVVALQKPNGRVRGIIIGDFPRRLVARSLAQHCATANSPFPEGQAQKQLSEPSPLPPKPTTSTQSSRSTASERTTPSPGQA
jgi:hypothetical protein